MEGSEQMEVSSATNAALVRLGEYIVGPTRFMNLVTCFELGIIDELKVNRHLTAAQIAQKVGTSPDAIEQLLHLLVKDDFVALDETTGAYSLSGLAGISDDVLFRDRAIMNMIKVVCLRQAFYLTESVKTGKVVGLQKLYGFDGNLYEAAAEHADLRESWSVVMDAITTQADPWFYANVSIPDNAKVLDLAGNTGLGAIITVKHKNGAPVHVTTFDLPEKEAAALKNFKDHGVESQCAFIGGDVFKSVPKGFDVVLIKHFLDMFFEKDVFRILTAVNQALEMGARVHFLTHIYPEDLKQTAAVDFFPVYFLGCTMAQGGNQKLSTYKRWFEECGFTVDFELAEDPASMTLDVPVTHGILSATKTCSL